jgi:hypothetical protein
MTNETQKIVAVSGTEHDEFGCPYCGYRSGYYRLSCQGTYCWECGECNKGCAVLADGLTKSVIGFGEDKYYPDLQDHPRRGIPKHGRSDERPAGGGEFFRSRGIGLDTTPGCFVCGGETCLHHNIAAHVRTKAAGERILDMFQTGAWLDWRERSPDYVQVKVGACETHLPNLSYIHSLVEDGILTEDIVKAAKEFKVG